MAASWDETKAVMKVKMMDCLSVEQTAQQTAQMMDCLLAVSLVDMMVMLMGG